MQNETMINLDEIKYGKEYRIIGDMINGMKDGKPFIHPADYNRPIIGIKNGKLYCKCERVFVVNKNLKVYKVDYERYED